MHRPPHSRVTPAAACWRLPAAALLATACGGAVAEPSPWYLGVNQVVSYNSNPTRQPDEFAKGSWWSTTSLIGGFDQRQGRQRFYGNGNVAANVYSSLSQLDNTSYGATAGWDWQTVNRLSGTLYASYNQGLADYGGFNQSNLLETAKVTQDSGLAYATVEYGLLSLWAADLRLAYNSVSYSSDNRVAQASFDRYNLDQTSVRAQVRKEFSGQLTAGTGVAYTRGDYSSTGQEFDRYDLFLVGTWKVTGLSTLSGRIGYSWTDFTGVNPYDENGATGWVAWAYQPTGKLNFSTRLSYDTLANSVFTSVGDGSSSGLSQSDQFTAGLQFSVRYAFSGKTSFNAALEYYSRSTDRANPTAPAVDERNRVTNASIGATWTPSRSWQVNCGLTLNDRNQRRDSGQVITLTPYTAYGGSCSAQFVLQ
jgi:hypothetical protein